MPKHTSSVNAVRLGSIRATLARFDDLVQRALDAVDLAEAAAGIQDIRARLSLLESQIDTLCQQHTACLLRTDARECVPLGICNPEFSCTAAPDACFERRSLYGIKVLEEEHCMLSARKAYLHEHCTDVKKAHQALFYARRGLHRSQEALAAALGC